MHSILLGITRRIRWRKLDFRIAKLLVLGEMICDIFAMLAMLACLHACLPAYLPACLLACLPACLLACLPADASTSILSSTLSTFASAFPLHTAVPA